MRIDTTERFERLPKAAQPTEPVAASPSTVDGRRSTEPEQAPATTADVKQPQPAKHDQPTAEPGPPQPAYQDAAV